MSTTRRHFLELATAGTVLSTVHGTSAQAKNTRPTIEELDAAAAKPVLRLDGLDSPVIIESIRLLKKGKDYYVHVRSKDGAEGIAFTNPKAPDLYPILNRRIIPYFIGKDARDLEEHLFGVYRYNSNYKFQSLALWSPVAWVEFAILDMLGRISGKSIAEMMGGPVRDRVKYYVATSRRDDTAEEDVAYLQKLLDETKAHAVKFRVGGRMSRNKDASPGRTKTLIPLARKVLGDKIDIHADSNSSYDPPLAIEIGRMLEDIGAVYFEEPCPFDHLEDTKLVTDTLTIPIALGEQESSDRRFRWMIANHAVDIVQPDLHYYGGLIRSTRVARMAALAGMPTTVHISGGFGFVYMLIFASFTPHIGKYQEYKRGIEKYTDLFDPPLVIRDGAMSVPQGPGNGITDFQPLIKNAKHIS